MNRSLALLALLLLASCTTLTDLKRDVTERVFGMEPGEPAMALADFKKTASASVLWRADVGVAEGYDFTPAVLGSSVFAANAKGDIVRLDAANGQQQWRVSAGEPLSGGVGAGENIVLAGTPKGMVLAFDHNGKALWKAKISSEVLSAPKVTSGVVVVRSGDSRIFGLSAADGSRKWVYERATPSLSLRSSAGVTLADGAAYVGFAGGKMVALKADDGKVLWEVSVAQPKGTTEIERIADITSVPAVDGRTVYAVAFQGRVAAVDRTTGRVLWNRDISSYTGLTAQDGRVFVTHSGGAVYALDDANGKSYWRQGGLLNRQLSAPLSLGSHAAVADLEGYVHFLSREDGAFSERIQVSGGAAMPQLVDLGNSTILVQTRGGSLAAIALK